MPQGVGTRASAIYADGVEDVLKTIGEQPILLALAVFFVGAILFMVLRNVLRLMIILALGLAAVAGFYYLADVEQPEAVSNLSEKAGKALKQGSDSIHKAGVKFGEKVGKEVGKAAKGQLEKALPDS